MGAPYATIQKMNMKRAEKRGQDPRWSGQTEGINDRPIGETGRSEVFIPQEMTRKSFHEQNLQDRLNHLRQQLAESQKKAAQAQQQLPGLRADYQQWEREIGGESAALDPEEFATRGKRIKRRILDAEMLQGEPVRIQLNIDKALAADSPGMIDLVNAWNSLTEKERQGFLERRLGLPNVEAHNLQGVTSNV